MNMSEKTMLATTPISIPTSNSGIVDVNGRRYNVNSGKLVVLSSKEIRSVREPIVGSKSKNITPPTSWYNNEIRLIIIMSSYISVHLASKI